jgi:hypothetical protein
MRRISVEAFALVITAIFLPNVSGIAHAQACWISEAQHSVHNGDDIGWLNIGVYNQGMMSGQTPNLDRLAWTA